MVSIIAHRSNLALVTIATIHLFSAFPKWQSLPLIMKSSETPSPRATLKAAMSLIPSLKTVLIQTQIFVATMCIRPNRAKHLNWWMLSWKRKMFYLSYSSIWRKSNDLWGKVATLWIVPGRIIVIRVRNWGCCRKIHSPLSSWRQNTFEKMWRLFAGQGWRLW